MNIVFFLRHFLERGTEVSIYNYAHYNESILRNKSIIVCFTPEKQASLNFPTARYTYDLFSKRFPIIEINDISEMTGIIEKNNISFFYTQTHGGEDVYEFSNKNIWGKCKTIKHCIFTTETPESDFYISISHYLNIKNKTQLPVIPYIVDLPDINQNLRKELNIPDDALVFGRYGGLQEFDISMAHQAICEYLNIESNAYFLFMNTNRFYEHPRIIYLDKSIDLDYKVKFINTCDAMIHARRSGETFGLAVAEFSLKNKPVITCPCGDLEHVLILKDSAILYHSKDELLQNFINFRTIVKRKTDWNSYKDYTPKNVMELFHRIFTI